MWPDEHGWLAAAHERFGEGEIADVAATEIRAKAGDQAALRRQLQQLRSAWPQLRHELREQLIPFTTLKKMLHAAGAPTEPAQIGISRERLRESYWQAFFIRRRFTVLDLAVRAGVLDDCLDEIFCPGGAWPLEPRSRLVAKQ
jgi:glycerol-1-phosphate dehydrogenase [NAD(P)+]